MLPSQFAPANLSGSPLPESSFSVQFSNTVCPIAVDQIEDEIQSKFSLIPYWYQTESIASLLAGRDTILYAPTNAGKSLVSQFFPLAVGGWVLVIIPLTRLGKEQVERVNRIPGLRADLLHEESNTKTNRSRLRQLLSVSVHEGGLSHR